MNKLMLWRSFLISHSISKCQVSSTESRKRSRTEAENNAVRIGKDGRTKRRRVPKFTDPEPEIESVVKHASPVGLHLSSEKGKGRGHLESSNLNFVDEEYKAGSDAAPVIRSTTSSRRRPSLLKEDLPILEIIEKDFSTILLRGDLASRFSRYLPTNTSPQLRRTPSLTSKMKKVFRVWNFLSCSDSSLGNFLCCDGLWLSTGQG